MGMNPMSPKAPPAPAAFKLLSELNEFMAHPLEERQAVLEDYATAAEQRQAAIETIAKDLGAAKVDREAAAQTIRDTEEAARVSKINANVKADGIVFAATKQAESVNETVAETVTLAKANAETWDKRSKKREDVLIEREAACEEREANAFEDREDAVAAREGVLAEAEKVAKRMQAEASKAKTTYETLIADINALQRRAPK